MNSKILFLFPLLSFFSFGESISGPSLGNNLGGWGNSGIKITAINDCTLSSFVFNNQGSSDTIRLMEASNNNVLQSISVNPTSPTHVVNANWELEAGKSYKILLTEASSGKWTSYSSFPQSSANLRVDSTVNLSSSYSNYWFTFTNLQISSTGAPSAPEITQGTGPISLSVSEDEPSNWTTNQVSATDADSDSNSLTWSLSAAPF